MPEIYVVCYPDRTYGDFDVADDGAKHFLNPENAFYAYLQENKDYLCLCLKQQEYIEHLNDTDYIIDTYITRYTEELKQEDLTNPRKTRKIPEKYVVDF